METADQASATTAEPTIKYHFWVSAAEQEQSAKHDKTMLIAMLDDGALASYTECSKIQKPQSRWKDLQYLGSGEIYEINGVKQGRFT